MPAPPPVSLNAPTYPAASPTRRPSRRLPHPPPPQVSRSARVEPSAEVELAGPFEPAATNLQPPAGAAGRGRAAGRAVCVGEYVGECVGERARVYVLGIKNAVQTCLGRGPKAFAHTAEE